MNYYLAKIWDRDVGPNPYFHKLVEARDEDEAQNKLDKWIEEENQEENCNLKGYIQSTIE